MYLQRVSSRSLPIQLPTNDGFVINMQICIICYKITKKKFSSQTIGEMQNSGNKIKVPKLIEKEKQLKSNEKTNNFRISLLNSFISLIELTIQSVSLINLLKLH